MKTLCAFLLVCLVSVSADAGTTFGPGYRWESGPTDDCRNYYSRGLVDEGTEKALEAVGEDARKFNFQRLWQHQIGGEAMTPAERKDLHDIAELARFINSVINGVCILTIAIVVGAGIWLLLKWLRWV